MKKLHSRSEFAKLANVHPAAITKAARAGRLDLAGKKIDGTGPLSQAFLAAHGASLDPDSGDETEHEAPGDGLNLRLARARVEKLEHESKLAALKLHEQSGALISRELVLLVISEFNAANLQMLRDLPKNLATTAIAAAKAGDTTEDIEAKIRKQISQILEQSKRKVVNLLRPPNSLTHPSRAPG